VETLVIGLNLCPFAKREWVKNRVRIAVTRACSEEALLGDLRVELNRLDWDETTETTLLVHPKVLRDFHDYNQFLNRAESLLSQMHLEGIYQIASFHPDYCFQGANPEDVENYTNRSPYPLLHLIREETLERAIDMYPDTDQIPARNMQLLRSMGQAEVQALYSACFSDAGKG
jgi:hypothetical protein